MNVTATPDVAVLRNPAEDRLNLAGLAGWDLVTITIDHTSRPTAYFKRQLTEEEAQSLGADYGNGKREDRLP